jgi:hypothetical protein
VFFSEAQAFERLMAIEDDLIDDYVCGDLSRQQRERFERHFLVSPERRERLALAEALVATVSEQPAPVAKTRPSAPWWESILDFFKFGNPTLRFAMVTASLVTLVFYGTKETLENNRLRQQNYQFQKVQEIAKQTAEQLQKDLATLRQQGAQREQELKSLLEPPTYVLKPPARTRGGTPRPTQDLLVARNAHWVELQLEFDQTTAFKSYRAVLKPYAGGNEIRLPARSTNKANVVVVTLPASIFAQMKEAVQEYQLTLWGADTEEEFQTIERYAFRVMKE